MRSSRVQSDSCEQLSSVSSLSIKQFQVYQWRLPITSVCLLSGFTVALLSAPTLRIDCFLEQSIDVLGYLFVFCGIAIRIWSISAIACKKSVEVVSRGPYALCRNPLYVGTFLISLGFLCLVQNLTMIIMALPVIMLYMFGVVPAEEAVMRERHGKCYEAYFQSTPRWIPSFSLPESWRFQPVWSKGVRKEIECAVWWLLIAAVVHILCDQRMEPWWFTPLDLP